MYYDEKMWGRGREWKLIKFVFFFWFFFFCIREPIQTNGSSSVQLSPPRHLTWSIENATTINQALQPAEHHAKQLIDDLDCAFLHNNDYGSNFMKRAKISPDSWMQMVFQLAYYRHYGQPCPTYESASTRKFLTGRTETVRSCTEESVAFTKAWDDKDIAVSTLPLTSKKKEKEKKKQ